MSRSSRLEEIREGARKFPCPTCGAEIGERCVNAKGEERISNHQARADMVRPRLAMQNKPRVAVEIVGDASVTGYVVYGIREKASGAFGYVGQTGNFASRVKAHTRAASRGSQYKRLIRWMHEIVTSGRTLEIVLLSRCVDEAESLALETEWVGRLAREGHDLTNKWLIHQEIIKASRPQ